jgi:large subunit ribosomal protein L29
MELAMSKKVLKTLKALSISDLASKAKELEQKIFKVRFQKTTGQLADVSSIWRLRKELAQVKTLENSAKGKV